MSQTYNELIKDKNQARELIAKSHFTSDQPVEKWEQARKFIAQAINHPGTILDIGCSNGFLLKSLQTWTELDLIPFGIDTRADHIADSKKMFPEFAANFVETDLDSLLSDYPAQFPATFDFIFWAVWVNKELTKDLIDNLLTHISPKGRLILGFYPDNGGEPSDVIGNIPKLTAMGYSFELMGNNVSLNRTEQLVVFQK